MPLVTFCSAVKFFTTAKTDHFSLGSVTLFFLVCMASSYVNNGAKFIVTNMDHKLPLSNPDITLPDVGAMVASVKVATEKDVDYIAGKPSRMAFEAIQSSCPGKIDSESTGIILTVFILNH